jgi:penicillin-binding protein 1A
MQAMHKNREVVDFPTPEQGIEWASIDYTTGLLAGPSTKYPFLEAFREGTAPTEISPDTELKEDAKPEKPTYFFDTEL